MENRALSETISVDGNWWILANQSYLFAIQIDRIGET